MIYRFLGGLLGTYTVLLCLPALLVFVDLLAEIYFGFPISIFSDRYYPASAGQAWFFMTFIFVAGGFFSGMVAAAAWRAGEGKL